MKEKLLKHIANISCLKLQRTCGEVLRYSDFLCWPASLSFHHAYAGGLLSHTVEVCDYARHIAGCMDGQENTDVLIASSVWHDVMKIEEYVVKERDRVKTDERFLFKSPLACWVKEQGGHAHIVNSTIEFATIARLFEVDKTTIDAVKHCILSHHGPVKEWGSPEAPKSIEAVILHQADYLSAKFGKTK